MGSGDENGKEFVPFWVEIFFPVLNFCIILTRNLILKPRSSIFFPGLSFIFTKLHWEKTLCLFITMYRVKLFLFVSV